MKLLQQALQGMQKVGPDFSIAVALLQRQRGWDVQQKHKQRHFVFQWDRNWKMGATFCHFQCCQKTPRQPNIQNGDFLCTDKSHGNNPQLMDSLYTLCFTTL